MLYHKNTASDFVFYQLTQSKYNLPNSHQYNNPRPHPHNNLYILWRLSLKSEITPAVRYRVS